MSQRGFRIDSKGRTIYLEPPPLSAEKRQYLAPLGSNLGVANYRIRRKRKRNFDGKEYSLIGLTRFRSDQSKTDFQHKAAKNVAKRLTQDGWNARVVRWKNQSGVYVRNKNTPKRNFEPTRFGSNARWTELDIQNSAPFMSEYFIGNDKSNRPLYPRRNKRAIYLGNRKANLAERPIIFHRKLSEAQKSKLRKNPQELDRRINNLQQAYEQQREVLIAWLMNRPSGIIRATIEQEQRQAILKKYGKNPPQEIIEMVNSMEFDYQKSLEDMREQLEKTEKKLRQYLELRDSIRSYDSKPKGIQCAGCGSKSKSRCRCDGGKTTSPMIDYDSITPEMEKEARERFVMEYVDEMSDDRSHGNEYLGYAAIKVQGEIEEGKIPKDMEIVKEKIAEYMAEYENETREYNRLVGDLWEFGDGVSTDYFTDLPFGGEFKNMTKSMKETLFDEIQKEIESYNPQLYREKLDRLSEAFDSDIQYLAHGGQRIVYEPTDERSGKLKGKVLKVNREFENHDSFDSFVREKNQYKNSTGYWEDYVSEYFKETAPFMLKYLLPAEPINDNYGDLAKHTVLQENVQIGDEEILEEALRGKATSIIIGDKKYEYPQIGDEYGLDYSIMIELWKKAIRKEINLRAESGEITKLKQKELLEWLNKADKTWRNFGVGDDMRFRLLDYEANPTSSFPKNYQKLKKPKVGGSSQ
tara:strand:- start:3207 stop:5288 length:2082 start_codon:yes stop_codon:yes gene_type:complete